MKPFKTTFLIFLIIIGISCSRKTEPKPYGYFRIDLPQNAYRPFTPAGYPYSFDISTYTVDSVITKSDEEYWININYPTLKGTIYCSYKPINSNFRKIIEDCRKFAYKHTVKADDIIERPYENPDRKVYGIMYEISGNVASPVQFFVTDSLHHLLRGALYFDATPNKDSIAPVVHFVYRDIVHLIETVQWKK